MPSHHHPRSAATPASPALSPGRIAALLRDDPVFRIVTVDGLSWVCPYTGTPVAAPFGFEQPAQAWLSKERPWQRAALKPLVYFQEDAAAEVMAKLKAKHARNVELLKELAEAESRPAAREADPCEE